MSRARYSGTTPIGGPAPGPEQMVRLAELLAAVSLATDLADDAPFESALGDALTSLEPPLAELVKRYEAAGGRYYVCPICFNAKQLSQESLVGSTELQGTVPMWAWIGDEPATTFSY